MNYLNHTLKACGPLALALILSACGEKNNQASALDDTSASEAQPVVADQSGEASSSTPEPVQSTISEEFSPPDQVAQVEAPVEVPSEEPAISGDPMVTLVARANSSLNGGGTQLEWSSENVQDCQTSGAWQGSVSTAGVIDLTYDASGDHTYMISCRGAQGTAMAMVTVTVESTSLAWEAPQRNTDGTTLTDLAGYTLYYGTESGQYSQSRPIHDPSQTQLELPVEPGTYYLAMSAYDQSGNESELSNEITRVVN